MVASPNLNLAFSENNMASKWSMDRRELDQQRYKAQMADKKAAAKDWRLANLKKFRAAQHQYWRTPKGAMTHLRGRTRYALKRAGYSKEFIAQLIHKAGICHPTLCPIKAKKHALNQELALAKIRKSRKRCSSKFVFEWL